MFSEDIHLSGYFPKYSHVYFTGQLSVNDITNLPFILISILASLLQYYCT